MFPPSEGGRVPPEPRQELEAALHRYVKEREGKCEGSKVVVSLIWSLVG